MTALLMRWQVIPGDFVVFFVIDLIFEIPRDHMLLKVKKIIIKTTHLACHKQKLQGYMQYSMQAFTRTVRQN